MGDDNIFISWSGARSKAAAEAVRRWLPKVLHSAKPRMSETDIEKGSRGLEEVGKALEGMKVGIICLTPENLLEPWVLYEAGALSKTLDAKTRVCTYLLGGLRKRDVTPPLALFQATEAEPEETRKLVHTVNKALDATPVPENDLNDLFDEMWPRLAKELAALPDKRGTAVEKRPVEDMVGEVLEITRDNAKGILQLYTDFTFLKVLLRDVTVKHDPQLTALLAKLLELQAKTGVRIQKVEDVVEALERSEKQKETSRELGLGTLDEPDF